MCCCRMVKWAVVHLDNEFSGPEKERVTTTERPLETNNTGLNNWQVLPVITDLQPWRLNKGESSKSASWSHFCLLVFHNLSIADTVDKSSTEMIAHIFVLHFLLCPPGFAFLLIEPLSCETNGSVPMEENRKKETKNRLRKGVTSYCWPSHSNTEVNYGGAHWAMDADVVYVLFCVFWANVI